MKPKTIKLKAADILSCTTMFDNPGFGHVPPLRVTLDIRPLNLFTGFFAEHCHGESVRFATGGILAEIDAGIFRIISFSLSLNGAQINLTETTESPRFKRVFALLEKSYNKRSRP